MSLFGREEKHFNLESKEGVRRLQARCSDHLFDGLHVACITTCRAACNPWRGSVQGRFRFCFGQTGCLRKMVSPNPDYQVLANLDEIKHNSHKANTA